MSWWIVTVCVGGAYTDGPAVLVEAETDEEAAREGVDAIMESDRGWRCETCERLNAEEVLVLPAGSAVLFKVGMSIERVGVGTR